MWPRVFVAGEAWAGGAWAGVLTRLLGAEGQRTRHLVLVEALDVGAEGTAHEALGSIRVVQEADLQGNKPILHRQGLHNLMALPVPHV